MMDVLIHINGEGESRVSMVKEREREREEREEKTISFFVMLHESILDEFAYSLR